MKNKHFIEVSNICPMITLRVKNYGNPHETKYSVYRAYQRQFANILYVKYADVILMMGVNCLTVKF